MLEGLLNELGIADLSTFEALLLHDTGAVLKIRCEIRFAQTSLDALGDETLLDGKGATGAAKFTPRGTT